ncbi:hypothetical protein [[Ruminococcus] lactaris]|uniref:hypothetical protein n=1 Tax=[Ruminococcus] lactaris TaxID=46228 RepID=UPI003520B635
MKKEILNKAKELMEMLLEEEKKGNVRLSEIPVGGKFDTGIGRFIVLEQKGEKTAVITEELYRKDVRFDDDSNEYFTSELSDLFEEEIFPEFKEEFGAENLCDATTSLVTVDMQNKDEELHAKARPLTFEEARKYNELLVNKDLPDWYWTCTAWSTEERGWPYSVAVVSPVGIVGDNGCGCSYGVRPFCILKSNIFVSKVEED